MHYFEEQTYQHLDFSTQPFAKGQYEYCHFVNCNFTGCHLSTCKFADSTFTDCNLSMAKANETVLAQVKFVRCKLLGLRFDTCSDFAFDVSFEQCNLNHASFYKKKLKKATFTDCSLHETEFTAADLTAAAFERCDLLRAVFDGSILEKADFRTAFNFNIDPERNRLKKARFAQSALAGLLARYELDIDAKA